MTPVFVAHNMTRNNSLNHKVHVAATELPQLLSQNTNMFREDNHIHITEPSAKYMYLIAAFRSPTANFIRHMVT